MALTEALHEFPDPDDLDLNTMALTEGLHEFPDPDDLDMFSDEEVCDDGGGEGR